MDKVLNNFGLSSDTRNIEGDFNTSLLFDGVDERMDCNFNGLNFTDGTNDLDFSIYAKVTLAAPARASNKMILTKQEDTYIGSASPDSWALARYDNEIRFYVITQGNLFKTFAYSTFPGGTYEMIINYDATTQTSNAYFKDFSHTISISDTGYTGMQINGSNISVGGRIGGAVVYIGNIFKAGVFDKQLSSEEADKLFNGANINTMEGLLYSFDFGKNTYWDGSNIKASPSNSTDYAEIESINMEETDIQ